MKVNVKKLDSNAVLPTYAKHGDAGMDLTATSKVMMSMVMFVMARHWLLKYQTVMSGYYFHAQATLKKI